MDSDFQHDKLTCYPLLWFMCKSSDGKELEANDDLSYRDFMHLASAQTIYYPDGQFSAAVNLSKKLNENGKAFPSVSVAKELFERTNYLQEYYELNITDDVWEFRSLHTVPEEYNPNKDNWMLYWLTDAGLKKISLEPVRKELDR